MLKMDAIIIGAGAAGLMCGISAGRRGRKVMILDHANKPGKKILMSGGGYCNFTNMDVSDEHFISHNIHFCKSALSRFTPWDFIDMVERHRIPYYEKKHGQLFCKNKSKDILNMLLKECEQYHVAIQTHCSVTAIEKKDNVFHLQTSQGSLECQSLVIATGGLSIPTMGATGFGYKIAKQFHLSVFPQTAALVPFILDETSLKHFDGLSGTSLPIDVQCQNQSFQESMLFTHKGLSGPAILQISSYWHSGDAIVINLSPNHSVYEWLKQKQQEKPLAQLQTLLSHLFTKKCSEKLCQLWFNHIFSKPIAELTNKQCEFISQKLHQWQVFPKGTEGYRTAEVTLGGVNTHDISSKTFEAKLVPGLFFIGEVLDMTGHLGGYNFQWAWSSGFAAGQYI